MTIKELIKRLGQYPAGDFVRFYVPSKKSFYYPLYDPEISRGSYRGLYIDLYNNLPNPTIRYGTLIIYLDLYSNSEHQIVMFLNDDHGQFYAPL
jgi:hypothetical protein